MKGYPELSEIQQGNIGQLRAEWEKRKEARAKLGAFQQKSEAGQRQRAQVKAAERPGGLVTKEEVEGYQAARRRLEESEQKQAASS